MNKTLIVGVAAMVLAGGAYFVTRPGDDSGAAGPQAASAGGTDMVEVTLPAELSDTARVGKTAFNAVCADCHGTNAAGNSNAGPPLIHKIYEPSHHGDMSFHMAVQNGVRAHHWRFGNMPAQDGLTRADVEAIIAYVRELQRANGIN